MRRLNVKEIMGQVWLTEKQKQQLVKSELRLQKQEAEALKEKSKSK